MTPVEYLTIAAIVCFAYYLIWVISKGWLALIERGLDWWLDRLDEKERDSEPEH